MEGDQSRPVEGFGETKEHYEFADLSPTELDRLKEAERQLGRDREKRTVLLAYEKREE